MPSFPRPLGLSGLGQINLARTALGDHWQDGDRARIKGEDAIAPWPGYNRTGRRLSIV